MSLPTYRSHRVVQAAKILAVAPWPNGAGTLTLQMPDAHQENTVDVDPSYMEKHKPAAGGYFIRYPDGYESWSPAETFEQGYALLISDAAPPGKPGQLVTHRVNGMNEAIAILATQPGPGGACHRYDVRGFNTSSNPTRGDDQAATHLALLFQHGPIQRGGQPNGVSIEALLAVCIHRLQGFQEGEYRCRENAIALTHLEDAALWLHKRTADRLQRGVEGTMTK